MRNPFQILEISPQSTLVEVHAAYKTMAKRFHPDLHPGEAGAEMARRMVELNWARDELKSQAGLDRWRLHLRHAARSPGRAADSWSAGPEPPPSPRRRLVRVSVEPGELHLSGRAGATATFTVRTQGASGTRIECRYPGRVLAIRRRAAEFGHATFLVVCMADVVEAATETIEVLLGTKRVSVVQVSLDPAPQAAGATPRSAARDDEVVSPRELRLPGRAGCRGSFRLLRPPAGEVTIRCSSPLVRVWEEEPGLFRTEVIAASERMREVEIELLELGRRLAVVRVVLAPAPAWPAG